MRTERSSASYLTPKAIQARTRNWNIRTLRMIHSQAHNPLLSNDERLTIQLLIDSALRRAGAETEANRRERTRKELEDE